MSLSVFAAQALSDFSATAAIAPSSPALARAMVVPLYRSRPSVVVELGPGTGAMTQELVRRVTGEPRILAFEVNRRFVDYLRSQFTAPHIEVIGRGAEYLADELDQRGIDKVDAVVSSLGLGLLPEPLVNNLIDTIAKRLDPAGVFTQFQYVHRMRMDEGRPAFFDAEPLLRRRFDRVRRRVIFRNLPPAFVYECRPGR